MGNSYAGVTGLSKKISTAYVGVNGLSKKITTVYYGVNGRSRLVYDGSAPLTQLVNYTMLYDLGDECVDITGGWRGYPYKVSGGGGTAKAPTVVKNAYSMDITWKSNGSSICSTLFSENKIDLSQYASAHYFGKSSGTGSYTTLDADLPSSKENNYSRVNGLTCPLNGMDETEFRTLDLSTVNSSCYMGILAQTYYGVYNLTIKKILLTKSDDISNLGYSTIEEALNNSIEILNNKSKVNYMIYNCTGNFMLAAVQSTTFMEALKMSPYKDIIYANEHWGKFLPIVIFENGVLTDNISIISNENCAWQESYPFIESIYIDNATSSIGVNHVAYPRSTFGYLSLDFSTFAGRTISITYNIDGGTSTTVEKIIESKDKYLVIGGINGGTMTCYIGFITEVPNKNIQSIGTSMAVYALTQNFKPSLRVTNITIK